MESSKENEASWIKTLTALAIQLASVSSRWLQLRDSNRQGS